MHTEDNKRTQHPPGDADRASFGVQGAAFILELQRLRQAFESEPRDEPPVTKGNRSASPRRAASSHRNRSRRRKRSKMARAFDLCLEQIGLRSAVPDHTADAAEQSYVARPLRESPSISPDRPLSLEAAKDSGATAKEGHPKLPAPAPAKRVEGLIRRGGAMLRAGAAFLLTSNSIDRANDVADAGLTVHVGRSFEGQLRLGLRVLLVVTLLGGGWLAFVPLAGAVVVPGNLVVQSSVKAIQHPTGGVVAEIKVANGSHVAAGDLLVRLGCHPGASEPPNDQQAARRVARADRSAGCRTRRSR